MFDLPTGTKADRKEYSAFRNFLLKDGYYMEQFSIYSRIILSRSNVETHIQRLRSNLPSSGIVTALVVTEKQYENRIIFTGDKTTSHHDVDFGTQLTLEF